VATSDDSEYGKDADPGKGGVTFLHGSVPSPEPLPRGQHDLSPEYVAHHQRLRILDATTYVLAERGYGTATIGDIVARAHVSRRTFYDHFDTKEQCVLATFGAAIECIADAVRSAYTAEDEWDAAMAAGLAELIRVLVEYPQTARTCLMEIRSVGAAAREPLASARLMSIDALRHAVTAQPGAEPVSDMAYELGTGGLIAVIRGRVAAGRSEELQQELPEMTRALLAPLAGREATEAVVVRLDPRPDSRAVHAI